MKKKIQKVLTFCKSMLNDFEAFLNEQGAKAEAELELRKITDSGYAHVMAQIAEEMSERYGTSFLWLMGEAKQRILAGEDKVDVLWSYEQHVL